jgi:hypothetical protein
MSAKFLELLLLAKRSKLVNGQSRVGEVGDLLRSRRSVMPQLRRLSRFKIGDRTMQRQINMLLIHLRK